MTDKEIEEVLRSAYWKKARRYVDELDEERCRREEKYYIVIGGVGNGEEGINDTSDDKGCEEEETAGCEKEGDS